MHPCISGGTGKSRKKFARGKEPAGSKYISSKKEETKSADTSQNCTNKNPKMGGRITGSSSSKATTKPLSERVLEVHSAYLSNRKSPQSHVRGDFKDVSQ
ncbi:hypothetical protein EVAR_21200_1 [Eumeta japonica]|uniref:Uncharacterized protein n=1 Tax=Eumeta variegata TaxID=151549 RepID=A0A4C1UPD6_EUMVA|nr:hypothetical protein EVAR_21200_1 [Eumeta japonica]